MNNSNNKNLREDLIIYANILNKYERGNYKLDEEEFDHVKKMIKIKEHDESNAKQIEKIQQMARSEREKYIEEYQKEKENEEKVKTTEEEIAETFDVSEKNINEEVLKDGKKLYVVYSDKLNKNIVLEENNKNQSLAEELKEINEEKKDDETKELDEIVSDKRLNDNMELSFVPIAELKNYTSYISNLSKEKLQELDCLVQNANSVGIEYINLENVVGIDKYGKIFESYYDNELQDYQISGTKKDKIKYAKEDEEENLQTVINEEDNKYINEILKEEEEEEYNKELDSMLETPEEEPIEENYSAKENKEEPKQLKKEYNEVYTTDEEIAA